MKSTVQWTYYTLFYNFSAFLYYTFPYSSKDKGKQWRQTTTSQERPAKNKKPSSSTVSQPEMKSQRIEKPPKLIPVDEEQYDVDFPSISSTIIEDDDDDDELPSMLYSSDEKKPRKQDLFHSGELQSSLVKDTSFTSLVECPLCSRFFPAKEVEFHASFCNGEGDATSSVSEPEVEFMRCPICSKLFPLTDIEQHANECVEATISECGTTMRRETFAI